MRLTRASVASVCGILCTLVGPTLHVRGEDVPDPEPHLETRDGVLRRLRAFRDMYGATERDRSEGRARRPEPMVLGAAEGIAEERLELLYEGRSARNRLLRAQIDQRRSQLLQKRIELLGNEPAAALPPTWVNIGPTNGAGRVAAIAVDPRNAAVIYRGTAGGGVFKSTDAGAHWRPLTDDLGNLSIGAVVVAPSNRDVLYVGTGEGTTSADGIDGMGLISSTDAGERWILPPSDAPEATPPPRFFALSVSPQNDKDVLAATLYGIQRSTDGGQKWRTTLSPGATALARLPDAPAIVLATVWSRPRGSIRGSGSVHRSTDGGDTWRPVGVPGRDPFPADTGRMSLAVATSVPQTVYLLAASSTGDTQNCPQDPVDQVGVFRSTDGGTSWALVGNPVTGRCSEKRLFHSILSDVGWYANSLTVDPADPASVYAGGLDLWKSTDAGVTWEQRSEWNLRPDSPRYVHADIHDLAWAGTMLLLATDGGIHATRDGGRSFASLDAGAVTRQYYSVAATPARPLLVLGGAQDNGTSLRINPGTEYREVVGGDGIATAAHPTLGDVVYTTIQEGRVYRSTDGGWRFAEVTPPYQTQSRRPEENDRLPFFTSLAMDPTDPNVVYTATSFLWKTTDGGGSWDRTSDTDLGAGDVELGYATKIAIAPSKHSQVLVGTAKGRVNRSTNGGATWALPKGRLPSEYVSHVEFDPTDAQIFYVAFLGSLEDGFLFKTTDGGDSFRRIDSGLPKGFPPHVIRVDPKRPSTLYVGCDVGLYRSTDGGSTWAGSFYPGLPSVSVWDLSVSADGSLIRVASHGRGFYELELK